MKELFIVVLVSLLSFPSFANVKMNQEKCEEMVAEKYKAIEYFGRATKICTAILKQTTYKPVFKKTLSKWNKKYRSKQFKEKLSKTLTTVCRETKVEVCPELMDFTKRIAKNAIMVALYSSKSDKHYIGYRSSTSPTSKLTYQTLIHELSHVVSYQREGIATHEHGELYNTVCEELATNANVNVNKACSAFADSRFR